MSQWQWFQFSYIYFTTKSVSFIYLVLPLFFLFLFCWLVGNILCACVFQILPKGHNCVFILIWMFSCCLWHASQIHHANQCMNCVHVCVVCVGLFLFFIFISTKIITNICIRYGLSSLPYRNSDRLKPYTSWLNEINDFNAFQNRTSQMIPYSIYFIAAISLVMDEWTNNACDWQNMYILLIQKNSVNFFAEMPWQIENFGEWAYDISNQERWL